jgi:hypothetical protein
VFSGLVVITGVVDAYHVHRRVGSITINGDMGYTALEGYVGAAEVDCFDSDIRVVYQDHHTPPSPGFVVRVCSRSGLCTRDMYMIASGVGQLFLDTQDAGGLWYKLVLG